MEISMTKEIIATTGNPHKALEVMRADLTKLIKDHGDKYEWYIIQSTNTEDGGLKLTAEFSEERKQHFIDHPLGS